MALIVRTWNAVAYLPIPRDVTNEWLVLSALDLYNLTGRSSSVLCCQIDWTSMAPTKKSKRLLHVSNFCVSITQPSPRQCFPPAMIYPENYQRSWLVGGGATPLKNMKVNWDDEIPNINGKIKMATKPPTRWCIHQILTDLLHPWSPLYLKIARINTL